jgi:hypothetical protein
MELAFWRDLSVIWLSLLCFIGLLIPLVALYYVVRGMQIVNQRALPLLKQAQTYSRLARDKSDDVADRVAEPMLRTKAQTAKWQRVWSDLWPDEEKRNGPT